LAIVNAAEGHWYWTLISNIWFHLDHGALMAYTKPLLVTPQLWCRMDNTLYELNLQIQYQPGDEMLAYNFARMNGDNCDGRYQEILLPEQHFSPEAWNVISKKASR